MLKCEILEKFNKILKETLEKKPYLTICLEDNSVEYFKEIASILKERMTTKEISVVIEDMCYHLAGNTFEGDKYTLLKRMFDSLILFQVDPEVVFGGAYEISGLTGINP